MVVYFGGYNNGSANNGQRVVFNSVGITNGSTMLLYDNFLADTTIDYVLNRRQHMGSSWRWQHSRIRISGSDQHNHEVLHRLDRAGDWICVANEFNVEQSERVGHKFGADVCAVRRSYAFGS